MTSRAHRLVMLYVYKISIDNSLNNLLRKIIINDRYLDVKLCFSVNMRRVILFKSL